MRTCNASHADASRRSMALWLDVELVLKERFELRVVWLLCMRTINTSVVHTRQICPRLTA